MKALAPLAAATLACLVCATPGLASTPPYTESPAPPAIGEAQAISIADRDAEVARERRLHPGLLSSAALVEGSWEVGYFAEDSELALVVVDSRSGAVRESWTGYQVAWKMARGYSGAFGHKLNAPYVFLPLCALFLIGLLDWRSPWRLANLDLLVLLSFGVSHFFFNRAEIGLSVPLAYPPLLYLCARALWIGLRPRKRPTPSGLQESATARERGLRPVWRSSWLLLAALFLLGLRVGLNVADSGVIDVGYAGVVGAERVIHGEQLYENFPSDVSQGDTYGPASYLAYVPFAAVWPWSGTWDDLPAAHAAAVFFDLATFALLFLLGRRIRPGPAGERLAAILVFGWAAYPYTAFALESNSNDSLVALLLVAALLALARPALRGGLAALATLTKFAPAALVPMLATYEQDGYCTQGDSKRTPGARSRSSWLPGGAPGRFALAFAAVAVGLLLWPALEPGLGGFYERTIGSQAGRSSPFSIWGQVEWLEPLRIALLIGTAALSLALAFVPRHKSLLRVTALGAALLILVQLGLRHWFYLYLVWFYPLLLVALAADVSGAEEPGPSPARSSRPGRVH